MQIYDNDCGVWRNVYESILGKREDEEKRTFFASRKGLRQSKFVLGNFKSPCAGLEDVRPRFKFSVAYEEMFTRVYTTKGKMKKSENSSEAEMFWEPEFFLGNCNLSRHSVVDSVLAYKT